VEHGIEPRQEIAMRRVLTAAIAAAVLTLT